MTTTEDELEAVTREVVACTKCPRLVAWRETVARDKRASFSDQTYWGRPVPSFGDPLGRLLVVGLAPAAHGGNRTGRIFTGDRSADWLFASLHRCGFSNQPHSTHIEDGLRLDDCFITAAVRCAPPANKPTTQERDTCSVYLQREIGAMVNLQVIVALGGFAWDAVLRAHQRLGNAPARPRPRFGHEAQVPLGRYALIGSYHPSQQNTFTGKLSGDMFDAVWRRARSVLGASTRPRRGG